MHSPTLIVCLATMITLVPAAPTTIAADDVRDSLWAAVRTGEAGSEFELLAVNEVGDVCMATPAISGGTLLVRSQHFLIALGRKQ
jgi:hypothetical protein